MIYFDFGCSPLFSLPYDSERLTNFFPYLLIAFLGEYSGGTDYGSSIFLNASFTLSPPL
jgi:hypothetical protein